MSDNPYRIEWDKGLWKPGLKIPKLQLNKEIYFKKDDLGRIDCLVDVENVIPTGLFKRFRYGGGTAYGCVPWVIFSRGRSEAHQHRLVWAHNTTDDVTDLNITIKPRELFSIAFARIVEDKKNPDKTKIIIPEIISDFEIPAGQRFGPSIPHGDYEIHIKVTHDGYPARRSYPVMKLPTMVISSSGESAYVPNGYLIN